MLPLIVLSSASRTFLPAILASRSILLAGMSGLDVSATRCLKKFGPTGLRAY